MILSDISIRRPVFAWMIMVACIVFGVLCFLRLGISQLPDVDFPVVSVSVNLSGAAPEVMETEVADVLEDAVMAVPGIKSLSSTSKKGQTTLSIELGLNQNIDSALQDIQARVAQGQRNLPKDIDPPVISKSNPEDQPIMWVALSGHYSIRELDEYVQDHVKDALTSAPGVGEVTLGGYVDPNVRVWVNRDKLNQRELTVTDIIRTIQNQHYEVPAGAIENQRKETNVRVNGEVKSVEEFENLIIPSRSGAALWNRIQIGDVATVEDGLADIRRISRTNEIPGIGLGIKKQRGVNAIEVSEGVKTRIKEIQKSLPKGMSLDVVFDTTQFIKDSTHDLMLTLLLSAVLTSLVCWLFMGSFSAALNIVLAIPTSILGTFVFLYFFGFTLNTFTLLGLSLVIGIVVDDAIMVLENIVRHREKGEGKVEAALIGAREITFAATAATVAILAIFVPVIFMEGVIGKFFYQFGVTISVAVALSLLEAITLAPMRCSQFLVVGHTSGFGRGMDLGMQKLAAAYRRALIFCLRWRWLVVIFAISGFVLSIGIFKHLNKEFVPAQDQSRFSVRLQTPLDSSITFTNEAFKKAEAKVLKVPGVERYFAAVGAGGDVNSGMIFVTLKPLSERPRIGKDQHKITQKEVMAAVRKEIKSVKGFKRVAVQDLSLSGFSAQRGFPIEFSLQGPEWGTLSELSQTFKEKMEASGAMVDVDSDYRVGMPEVVVTPDRDRAAARGVDIADIGDTVQALIGGVPVGKYTENGKRYDVRVRLQADQRAASSQIQQLYVQNNHGEMVPLSEVVTVSEHKTLSTITRKNRERAITMFANMAPGVSQEAALSRVNEMAKSLLPTGYRMVWTGSAQTFQDSFSGLGLAMILGIFVAYMVLASQFNSFAQPLVVLLALPFSITGAFAALYLTHQSINIYSAIGIILLMGIVKKNSILLVDFTNQNRAQGLSVYDALLTACPIRLRPILMTSIATIAAAVPPALAVGPGAETRIPMAVVIIGGVFVSTVLTLFVVPCAYSLMARNPKVS